MWMSFRVARRGSHQIAWAFLGIGETMTDGYSTANGTGETDQDQQDLPGQPDQPSDNSFLAGDDEQAGGDDTEHDGGDAGFDEDDEFAGAAGVAGDDLRHLVLFVASSLVDRPDEVEVHAAQRGQSVQLTLVVPEDELGKVIGRQGRIARAIRTVTMIAGSRHNVRASLDIEG